MREILKARGLLGYKDERPDKVEACKVIFEYENREVSVEFVSWPKDEFDGTHYVTGISPVIAVNMRVKGEGVLPPERVVNSKEFLFELKKKGIKLIYQERYYYYEISP